MHQNTTKLSHLDPLTDSRAARLLDARDQRSAASATTPGGKPIKTAPQVRHAIGAYRRYLLQGLTQDRRKPHSMERVGGLAAVRGSCQGGQPSNVMTDPTVPATIRLSYPLFWMTSPTDPRSAP
jgi:hypothetical protein